MFLTISAILAKFHISRFSGLVMKLKSQTFKWIFDTVCKKKSFQSSNALFGGLIHMYMCYCLVEIDNFFPDYYWNKNINRLVEVLSSLIYSFNLKDIED